MDIRGKTVLVLGGWGLVGSAICRDLVTEKPKRIIVTSLLEAEARDAVAAFRREFPQLGKRFFHPWWGNIFQPYDLKDTPRSDVLRNRELRNQLTLDLFSELTGEILERSTLYRLLREFKPDIVVDCINSATAIAYQDVFAGAREVRQRLAKNGGTLDEECVDAVERLLATLYIPQLIRHVQILYRSMQRFGSKVYVKIGTSGTGGMGLNIPYTHSEERPSSVLLSKSAVAGAHTLLLFLMGRTPDAPITLEVKPTAAIAWKKISYGEIRKGNTSIKLYDCPPGRGIHLKGSLSLTSDDGNWTDLGTSLKSVFIDTGENGIFSKGEFEAISTPGQMEYVTPEEIAESVIFEIKGGNTGHDIINALDNATLAPTYRAGFLFESARDEMTRLEEEHGVNSVAFEFLGPPRLSKLLFEAHLLRRTFKTINAVMKAASRDMVRKVEQLIKTNSGLRAEILSIGIPILMPDGETLLRGPRIKIPPFRGENELKITDRLIDTWAHDGWVDLRRENMEIWKERFKMIRSEIEGIPKNETSSRNLRTKKYWNDYGEIDPGKIVGWIFTGEEKGKRMKA